jgi:hypothetical protein
MGLVIILALKLTRSATTGHDSIQTTEIKALTKINTLVTLAHVLLILVYTVLSILKFNVPRSDGSDGNTVALYRVDTAWVLFGGF